MRMVSCFLLLSFLLSMQEPKQKLIHVYVALCDNDSQGIVPVPKKIGNGNDPENNLYWGCGYGVRTFFRKATEWKNISSVKDPETHMLERCVFKHKTTGTWLVAEAYRGSKMKNCVIDFLSSSAGHDEDTVRVRNGTDMQTLDMRKTQLVCFVGHDGLMDFDLESYPQHKAGAKKEAMILACYSKKFFTKPVKEAGATPLLWTTGLMCPEAYTLHAAVEGWIRNETGAQLRERAAQAYDKYLHCGIKGARNLFATGF